MSPRGFARRKTKNKGAKSAKRRKSDRPNQKSRPNQ